MVVFTAEAMRSDRLDDAESYPAMTSTRLMRMEKRGVEFDGPPEKQPWGKYAMFKDSEGNRFVLSAD